MAASSSPPPTLDSVNVDRQVHRRVRLKRPNAFFEEYYGTIRDDVALAIYSKNRVDQLGPEAATTELPDGGTGPYQIESWTADTEIVLKAFPDYWGEQPPVRDRADPADLRALDRARRARDRRGRCRQDPGDRARAGRGRRPRGRQRRGRPGAGHLHRHVLLHRVRRREDPAAPGLRSDQAVGRRLQRRGLDGEGQAGPPRDGDGDRPPGPGRCDRRRPWPADLCLHAAGLLRRPLHAAGMGGPLRPREGQADPGRCRLSGRLRVRVHLRDRRPHAR